MMHSKNIKVKLNSVLIPVKNFQQYVNNNISFSPNSMYMSNNVEIIDRFYQNLFEMV